MITVNIFPDKYARCPSGLGADLAEEECGFSTPGELFSRQDTDAHFTTYRCMGENGEPQALPRLSESLTTEIRDRNKGLGPDAIEWHLLTADVDTPGHATLAEMEKSDTSTLAAFLANAINAFTTMPNPPTYWYSTRGGFRALWELDSPVTDEWDWTLMQCGVNKELVAAGIPAESVDDTSAQPYRLFRLPKVNRDGTLTDSDPYYMEALDGKAVATADMPRHRPTKAPRSSVSASTAPSDIPDPTEARKLVEYIGDNGMFRYTGFGSTAKRKLKGTVAFDMAFDPSFDASEGERNRTICSCVGTASNRLPDNSREELYGLFSPAAHVMGEDGGTRRPFLEVLWDVICRYYADRETKREQEVVENEALRQSSSSVMGNVIDEFRTWTSPAECPELFESTEGAESFVSSHMFALYGKFAYMLNAAEGGVYGSHDIDRSNLGAAVLKNQFAASQICKIKDNELEVPSINRLCSHHGTVVHSVEMIPQFRGGRIVHIDTDRAALMLGMYRRDPWLERNAEYSSDVDDWLKGTFGEHYSNMCRWLSRTLAFEEGPMCALSIEAGPGIGKGMLAHALSKCLEVPHLCTGAELLSDFNGSLVKTPFIHVDEGWGVTAKRSKHPANIVRELTGGTVVDIREMYKPNRRVHNPCRIFMTANNTELVKELSKGQVLSPADKEALTERVYHFRVHDDNSRYLASHGHYKLTEGWLDGEKILPKHIMWMYQHREDYGPQSQRYALSGKDLPGNQVGKIFRSDYLFTPLVVESLVELINSRVGHGSNKKIDELDTSGIYLDLQGRSFVVTPKAVLDVFRRKLLGYTRGESLTLSKIKDVLVNYSYSNGEGRYRINCTELLKSSKEDGFICKGLETLAR